MDQDHSTSDLYLAAALTALRFPLSRIERRDGRAWFVFAPDDELVEAISGYFQGRLPVDARAYADGLRALKGALHSPGVRR